MGRHTYNIINNESGISNQGVKYGLCNKWCRVRLTPGQALRWLRFNDWSRPTPDNTDGHCSFRSLPLGEVRLGSATQLSCSLWTIWTPSLLFYRCCSLINNIHHRNQYLRISFPEIPICSMVIIQTYAIWRIFSYLEDKKHKV